ncbi:MAG: hypothetical protein PHQ22_03310 [Sulfuricurvum sp.]|nr:hypothetical protein [Sulfuricurvum sp.]MDD5386203.1 hypothetical protein [Sulfuricurvum sp.]
MNQRLLTFLALIFVALVIMQAVIGAVLFAQLVGISPDEVIKYYGNKSLHGMLEVMLPHVLFISIALMASLHFLAFIDTLSKKEKTLFTQLLFTLFFMDQVSPIFISYGIVFFAYVKIVAFFGFEGVLGWVWIVIFRESLLNDTSRH